MNQTIITARVCAVNRGLYQLMAEDGTYRGRISAKLRRHILADEAVRRGLAPEDFLQVHESGAAEHFPTVGDYVSLELTGPDEGLITAMQERKSAFVRSNFSGHAAKYAKTIVGQAVAANFDYVLILSSLNQEFSLGRLERYLVLAWQTGATPIVVLTKADLADDAETTIRLAEQTAIGAEVYCVSAKTGQGLSGLAARFAPNDTLVFLGSSGVGKSSLINALAGEEIMRVSEIREDDARGRHTTTHRQLLRLPSGLTVIDTPGMREVGMWNANEGLSGAFADVEEFLGNCKFHDCRHAAEPGCAIKEALQNGALDASRWESYQKLQRETRFAEGKDGYLRQKNAMHKSISLSIKSMKKEKKP